MSNEQARTCLDVALVVFVVALALRLVPLLWSPLPATLDGFGYASLAHETVTQTLPLYRIGADEFVLTVGLAMVSEVIGMEPRTAVQPFAAMVGAAAPVVASTLAYVLGRELQWSRQRLRLVTALVGFSLAIQGLFLRRTGEPDEETVGLLLVPILAYVAHQMFVTRDQRWMGLTAIFIFVFPFLHNLSATVAVLTVTALVFLHVTKELSRDSIILGGSFVGGFWLWFWGYFELAESAGLRISFSGLFRDHPGLLLAWIVVLIIGVVWFRGTSKQLQRATFLLSIGSWFVIVIVNVFTPIFPGTVPSPPLITLGLIMFLIPVILASRALPIVRVSDTGALVLSLVAAPIALTYYALTAELTPQHFVAVVRMQTFAHLSVFLLAGFAVTKYALPTTTVSRWRQALGGTAVSLFVITLLVTAPLGYVNLDTGSYPSTTMESEFQAATFATTHVNGTFASDHTISNIATDYANSENATMAPTIEWLRGNPRPRCAFVSQTSWTTTGAHLYPAGPETVTTARHSQLLATSNLVYTTGGHDPLYLTVPRSGSETC
ncbi:hypothetical protein SAMN04487948_1395 [Halogranum amylolyticum]|uniref:Dolichyl-phosphate-mannose-protein mannosyltransferase n=1 Tax=Halogranum amylolyticum TaxID=660520 RepID=A0A1H8WRF4_9EURY|nr:sodium/phosphate symporter [Halogranum amylolyticum]SEP30304.1 hypothetical protein SAMN04487948_1395 [Halogranum amylolyticum]